MKTKRIVALAAGGLLLTAAWIAGARRPGEPQTLNTPLSLDHYVRVKSAVPSMAGQPEEIYLRERSMAGTVMRSESLTGRVVLFIHGAGTPAEVAFDVPYEDYSWMGYLANQGYDTFSVDNAGYGRSTRPAPMDDPCNLSAPQQKLFIPALLSAPCPASYPGQLTTIASDWNEIDAAVNYIRTLRHVDRVSLVGWSLGGPRAGGYAGQHPDKVEKLILLAPAYSRTMRADAPAKLPVPGTTFNTQSHAEFLANWDRQVGCSGQYEPAVAEAIWSQMLESDPVGATWGTGVRRAPSTTTWGWTTAMVAQMQVPTLMVTGDHDKQVPSQNVHEFYDDFGAHQKVIVDLACSSHNAMWEKNHNVLFKASLDWLERTAINGTSEGVLKLGN